MGSVLAPLHRPYPYARPACTRRLRYALPLRDASEGLHSRRAASPAFPQAAAEAPPHDSPLPPLQREHSSPKRHGQGEELAAAPPLDSALVGSVQAFLFSPSTPLSRCWHIVPTRHQEEERVASCRMCGCLFTVDHVAPLVALSDTLGFVGNGMTVKFFPVFFKDVRLSSPPHPAPR